MYHRRFLVLMISLIVATLGVTGWLALAPHPSRAALQTELRVCNTSGRNYQTIQAAVDAAQLGDVIKVAAGVYAESKMVSGFPYNLYITKTVEILGGFTCDNWTTRSYTENLTTILPVNPAFAVVTIAGQYGQSATFAPTLDGFTIRGARSDNHGGGLRLIDTDAIIRNNAIQDNTAYLLGGGVWVQRGAPRLEHNRIENNRVTLGGSGYGGGIELEGTQATLIGNIISSNVVSNSVGYGGGVSIDGGGPVLLVDNKIVGNASAAITSATPQLDVGYGGGVFAQNAKVQLTGNLVQSNIANAMPVSGSGGAIGHGGGIFITHSPAFTLTGNTIISNTAGYKTSVYLSGGGLRIEFSDGRLTGNVIAGNRANGKTTFGNGGGLAVFNSTLTIQGGRILNNKTTLNCEGYGGGLYAANSQITINNTTLYKNCAANTPFYGLGGGLAFINSPYTLTNSIIDQNYAFGNDTSVGGIFAGENSPGLIVNNTIANNNGQGIRFASAITVTNNIILGHTTGISRTHSAPVTTIYNNFYDNNVNQRGFNLDPSNIVIDPQLDADFHLNAGSPAIDAGTRTSAPLHDFDGEPRPMQGHSG